MPNTPQEAPQSPDKPAQGTSVVTEAMLAAGRAYLGDDNALRALYAAMTAMAPRVARETDPIVSDLTGALKMALQALDAAGQKQAAEAGAVGRIKVVVDSLMTSLRAAVAAHEQAATSWIPEAKAALEQAREVLA